MIGIKGLRFCHPVQPRDTPLPLRHRPDTDEAALEDPTRDHVDRLGVGHLREDLEPKGLGNGNGLNGASHGNWLERGEDEKWLARASHDRQS
jgi:hypothetical protein